MDTMETLQAQVAALQAENEALRAQQKQIALRSSTPYDDAWRTLTTCAPQFLIPMVNLVDLFTVKALRAMTHTVVNGLAEKFPRIKEGVNEVVGGNIIEFEALKILRKGEQRGIQKGKMQELFGSVQDGDMKPERAARRAGMNMAVFMENMRKAGYAVPEARVQGTGMG